MFKNSKRFSQEWRGKFHRVRSSLGVRNKVQHNSVLTTNLDADTSSQIEAIKRETQEGSSRATGSELGRLEESTKKRRAEVECGKGLRNRRLRKSTSDVTKQAKAFHKKTVEGKKKIKKKGFVKRGGRQRAGKGGGN